MSLMSILYDEAKTDLTHLLWSLTRAGFSSTILAGTA